MWAGQCFYADNSAGGGDTLVTIYQHNRRVGEGLLWVQGCGVPRRMRDGEILEAVGDGERGRILAALVDGDGKGLPAEHTPQGRPKAGSSRSRSGSPLKGRGQPRQGLPKRGPQGPRALMRQRLSGANYSPLP